MKIDYLYADTPEGEFEYQGSLQALITIEDQVNERLSAGWKLHGELKTTPLKTENGKVHIVRYIQAVILDKDQ